jgi:hypothetical protein
MPVNRPGKKSRLIYVEQDLDEWLRKCAKEEERTITSAINRALRVAKAASENRAG